MGKPIYWEMWPTREEAKKDLDKMATYDKRLMRWVLYGPIDYVQGKIGYAHIVVNEWEGDAE